MDDAEFLADVTQQSTYNLTREEFERLVELARKAATLEGRDALRDRTARERDERITELEAALKEAREVEEAFLQLHGWITNWETSFDEDTDWIEHVKPEIERVAGKLLSARALSPAAPDEEVVERVAKALFNELDHLISEEISYIPAAKAALAAIGGKYERG